MEKIKRAAQYIRMSTDMQRYSIENQSAAIAVYAAARGLVIVRSYIDAARSGLRIETRNALKSLIDDVVCHRAEFTVILVYDVSRWGRFQDIDESAYYEFICKKAGVSVEYCAEQFENDGSLLAAILKNLKRAMAGEFSRELSVRVRAGQSRLAAKGFRFGSSPGFALRRMLIDENGNHKAVLGAGERKTLHSEHTILVPGPKEEIDVVRYVYDQFLDAKQNMPKIARSLNAQGILNSAGRPWTNLTVRELLTNEKYIGTNVYGRTSRQLGNKPRPNPKSAWIRKPGAFEAIISPTRFEQVQRRLKVIRYRFTKSEMLDFLSAIWCKNGLLDRWIIDNSPVGPGTNTIKRRFGTLTAAYRLIGFTSHRLENRASLRTIRDRICDTICGEVNRRGGTFRRRTARNCMITINDELDVLVAIGRASRSSVARHQNYWRFGYRCQKKPDLLVIARVDHGSSSVRDYYFLPFLFFPHGSWLTVSGNNYQRLELFHSLSLEPLFELCSRTPLGTRSPWLTAES
jgi:DNA invertase Pin-like site-specific DNA recombinase